MSAVARKRPRPMTPLEELGSMVLDPVLFSTGLLGHDLYNVEKEILDSIATNDRTAVKACHASGKTFTAGDAVLWWTARYEDGIVLTTAPTWTQVKRQLWGQIRKSALGGRVKFPNLNTVDLQIGPDNYAIGISTNEGVRFQGFHGTILIILDEAPGVLSDIYEAVDGIRAGGKVHVLLLGQPMVIGGPFYDAFHARRSGWRTITISAFDTPNLAGCCVDNMKRGEEHVRFGDMRKGALNLLTATPEQLAANVRPYLTSRKWVHDAWYDWHETGSPLWDVKVMGNFPQQSEDSLFFLKWIEQAQRIIPGYEDDPLDVGIDVAGPGEAETVVSVRQGPNRVALKWWLKDDPRGEVMEFLRPLKARVRSLNIDSVGNGYYFAKHFEDDEWPVRYVNVGQTEFIDTERFTNQKGAYYWSLHERAKDGRLGGITDPVEQGQLTGMRYSHDPRGRVVIESKDEMRERGLVSPDRAEADMLAFAPAPPPPPPQRKGVESRAYVNR